MSKIINKLVPNNRANLAQFGTNIRIDIRRLDSNSGINGAYFGFSKPDGQTVVCTVRTSGVANVRIERHREFQT